MVGRKKDGGPRQKGGREERIAWGGGINSVAKGVVVLEVVENGQGNIELERDWGWNRVGVTMERRKAGRRVDGRKEGKMERGRKGGTRG
jgi:hypothetical protein